MTETIENPYINEPTRALVEGIAARIDSNPELKASPEVQQAFAEFAASCRQAPPIVDYIHRHTDPGSPEEAGFTKKEFTLLNASAMWRSSSTYAAIPYVVTALEAIGFEGDAATIGRNMSEELGGKKSHREKPDDKKSHRELLFTSMQAMGEALRCPYLSPISYGLARALCHMRQDPRFGPEFGNNPGDFERFKKEIKEKGLLLPDARLLLRPSLWEYRFDTAVKMCNLAPPSIGDYHNEVLRTVLGRDERGDFRPDPDSLHPNRIKPLAIGLLELAMREASSVDEHEAGKLSYIGARGKFVEGYMGYLRPGYEWVKADPNGPPVELGWLTFGLERFQEGTGMLGPNWHWPDQQKQAMEWSHVHNDELAGQAAGWKGDAESGHAEDARRIALNVMSHLYPEAFAATLREITRLNRLRNKFWQDIVDRLEELRKDQGPDNPLLPLRPGKYVSPQPKSPPSTLRKWGGRAGMAAAIFAGGYMAGRTESPAPPAAMAQEAYISLSGPIEALWQKNPAALDNPEQLARAGGRILRKINGRIALGQEVCRYECISEDGQRSVHIIKTGEHYEKDIAAMKELLRHAPVRGAKQARQR